MTNRHSVCSLVRFAINSPGKTVHSGRGYYTMRHGLSATELMNKLTGVAKWAWQKQGILESVCILDPGFAVITFKPETTVDGTYRTVYVYDNDLTVHIAGD